MLDRCSVCGFGEQTAANKLVTCGNCSVTVHQGCYGVPRSIGFNSWFCRKCESQVRISKIRCDLCPIKDGAFKRSSGSRCGWAHVLCAIYIPEVYFKDPDTMDLIVLENVPMDRCGRSCIFCERNQRSSQANYGACIQCAWKTCRTYFHVTCCSLSGLLSDLPFPESIESLAAVISRKITSITDSSKSEKDDSRKCDGDIPQSNILKDPSSQFGQVEAPVQLHGFCSLTHKEKFQSDLLVPKSVPSSNDSQDLFGFATTQENRPSEILDQGTVCHAEQCNSAQQSTSSEIGGTDTGSVTIGLCSTEVVTVISTEGGPDNLNPQAACCLLPSECQTDSQSHFRTCTTPGPAGCAVEPLSKKSKLIIDSAVVLDTTCTDVSSTSEPYHLNGTSLSPQNPSLGDAIPAGDSSNAPIQCSENPPSSNTPLLEKPDIELESSFTDKGDLRDENEAASVSKTATTIIQSRRSRSLREVKKADADGNNVVPSIGKTKKGQKTGSVSESSLRHDHQSPIERSLPLVCPQRPLTLRGLGVPFKSLDGHSDSSPGSRIDNSHSTNLPAGSSTESPAHSPLSTMQDLLEWQWDQAGALLMQQAEGTDVVSLLDCLHQLKSENDSLEAKLIRLKTRQDHLKSVNARLSASLATMEATVAALPAEKASIQSNKHSVQLAAKSDCASNMHNPGSPTDCVANLQKEGPGSLVSYILKSPKSFAQQPGYPTASQENLLNKASMMSCGPTDLNILCPTSLSSYSSHREGGTCSSHSCSTNQTPPVNHGLTTSPDVSRPPTSAQTSNCVTYSNRPRHTKKRHSVEAQHVKSCTSPSQRWPVIQPSNAILHPSPTVSSTDHSISPKVINSNDLFELGARLSSAIAARLPLAYSSPGCAPVAQSNVTQRAPDQGCVRSVLTEPAKQACTVGLESTPTVTPTLKCEKPYEELPSRHPTVVLVKDGVVRNLNDFSVDSSSNASVSVTMRNPPITALSNELVFARQNESAHLTCSTNTNGSPLTVHSVMCDGDVNPNGIHSTVCEASLSAADCSQQSDQSAC